MPRRNLATGLRCRKRRAAPMAAYDAAPPPLRRWLAQALLPWSVDSARRLWRDGLRATGDEAAALARLSAREAALVARDAALVWGTDHPSARRG
jgi:hypothetical protein